jgi:hypothetical protein
MRWPACLLYLWAGLASGTWQFSAPVDVLAARPGVFPHLESANRQGLAESGGVIAVVWEDNRSGISQCYARFKNSGVEGFGNEVTLSTQGCAEPVIIGLGNKQFIAGWEEDGAVWVARVEPGVAGAPVKLSHSAGGQVTLAYDSKGGLHAAWVERNGDHLQLWTGTLTCGVDGIRAAQSATVENIIPAQDQSYPALSVNPDGSEVVVWEDRRFKHTVILASHSADGARFDLPYRLIEVHARGPSGLGAGLGAMRPTLARCGLTSPSNPAKQGSPGSCVVAVWLDKRDFLSGYDVYAAISTNGGESFGHNIQVQDSFGENIAQWHASLGANQRGKIAVVWDDDRDGTADIWLATWVGSAFSDNVAVPGASGPGIQTEPLINLDDSGRLNLIWLDRPEEAMSARIRYVSAVWEN